MKRREKNQLLLLSCVFGLDKINVTAHKKCNIQTLKCTTGTKPEIIINKGTLHVQGVSEVKHHPCILYIDINP